MLRNVFTKALWDNWRAWLGWAAALSGIAAMYSAFWPSVGNSPAMVAALDAYPEAIREAFGFQDYSHPANYLASAVFGLLVPFLIAAMSISGGMKAIAGDEEAGTLDLVMAHPVGRWRLALQRIGAVGAGVLFVTLVIGTVVAALRGPAEFTEVPVGNIYATVLQLALFGALFAAISFAAGAATGSKGVAIGAGAAVAVVGYLANSFLPQIDSLKWLEKFSPFSWYLDGEPLKHGLDPKGVALLAGVSVLAIALGGWRFSKRDLAV